MTSSEMRPDKAEKYIMEKLQESLDAAERVILKWDIKTESRMLLQGGEEEINRYMNTVENLHHLMQQFSPCGELSPDMTRSLWLLETAMARLKKEFHEVLSSYSEALDPESWSWRRKLVNSSPDESMSTSSNSTSGSSSTDKGYEYLMLPLGAVAILRRIAEIAAKIGYGSEYVRLFILCRKSVVEESLYNLSVEKFKLNNVRKMKWELLEEKIRKWIYAAKISIRVLFAAEKKLCGEVFEGVGNMRDYCFGEIAEEPTGRLLGFAEAVAATSDEPERLFRVLDVYETLADLVADMEDTYDGELCEQAERILARLGEAARRMLTAFVKAFENDKSRTAVAGGAVHPLTKYVMNYLTFLGDYRETLVHITPEAPGELPFTLPDVFSVQDAASPLSIRLGWTVFLLLCKLETKSDLYKDTALSYLFLVNNVQYIVQKVQGCELKFILGEEWVRKQVEKVRQYTESYEKVAWGKVFSFVTDDKIGYGGEDGYGEEFKDTLKGLNLAMQEVKRRHVGWVVADVSLREQLGASILEKLVPAYCSFLERYRTRFEMDSAYIKYTPQEVSDFVLDMFKESFPSTNKVRFWW